MMYKLVKTCQKVYRITLLKCFVEISLGLLIIYGCKNYLVINIIIIIFAFYNINNYMCEKD